MRSRLAREFEMDGKPSFRRCRDLLKLFLAILVPWLMLAVAIIPALVDRESYRAGLSLDWVGSGVAMWYYAVSLFAIFGGVVLLLLGLWRLAWYPVYRRSLYGWAWPLLMFVSIGFIP